MCQRQMMKMLVSLSQRSQGTKLTITVVRPNTFLAIALTRLSTSPKGGLHSAGVFPVKSVIIWIVHPSSPTTCSFVSVVINLPVHHKVRPNNHHDRSYRQLKLQEEMLWLKKANKGKKRSSTYGWDHVWIARSPPWSKRAFASSGLTAIREPI